MPVTKVIEVIGTSAQGSDDAVREAVTAAGRSIRGITAVEVVSLTCDVEEGNIARWNALVKLSFPVEPREPG
jgi:dodecin